VYSKEESQLPSFLIAFIWSAVLACLAFTCFGMDSGVIDGWDKNVPILLTVEKLASSFLRSWLGLLLQERRPQASANENHVYGM